MSYDFLESKIVFSTLTFHFFPIFNVGFSDSITLSFESSSIIWSLIFPDLNSSTIDLNGNFNFTCLQYKATSNKPGGKLTNFRVYLFILASIDSTVLVTISYTSSGHNNIGINICCRHPSLDFSCKGQRSILWRPSCNVLYVSFAWLISFKDSSNQRSKLFTGSSDSIGILWPPTLKFLFWFSFPFLRERLLDFLGLNFFLHQMIYFCIRLSILRVVNSLDERIIVLSLNAFIGGIWNPLPNSTISAMFSVAFRSGCIARTKSIGNTEHPIAIPTSSLFQFVVYSSVVNHMRKPSRYVPNILDISAGIWYICRDNSIIWWGTEP